MKLYAASTMAVQVKLTRGGAIQVLSKSRLTVFYFSGDHKAAWQEALAVCRQQYPVSEGWQQHQAEVIEITGGMMAGCGEVERG